MSIALPNDVDALRALVSQLTSERDVALAERHRLTEENESAVVQAPAPERLIKNGIPTERWPSGSASGQRRSSRSISA
jgi:hypothetical protein